MATVGLIQLYSTETGEPLAFMPDGVVQGMRVGGTYGLAVKYLARKNATTMGLLGSGHQARFQVASAQVARPLKHVKRSEVRERQEYCRPDHSPHSHLPNPPAHGRSFFTSSSVRSCCGRYRSA
jgi:hypothetical protein